MMIKGRKEVEGEYGSYVDLDQNFVWPNKQKD